MGVILTALSFVFIIYKLWTINIDYSKIVFDARFVLSCIAGLVLAVLSVYVLAFAWTRIVSYYSSESSKAISSTAISVYCRSNAAKYLPGNVFQYVERNLFLTNSGLRQFEIAACSIIEIASLLLAGMLLSFAFSYKTIFYVLTNYLKPHYALLLGTLFVTGLIVLVVLFRKNETVRSFIKSFREPAFIKLIFTNLLIHMIALVMIAMIIVLVYTAITPEKVSFSECITVLSSYIVSWIAGFIVIGAPGGIGIRETVISLVTESAGISDIVLVAAILQRIITIIGDLIPYLFSLRHRHIQ